MKRRMIKAIGAIVLALLLTVTAVGCAAAPASTGNTATASTTTSTSVSASGAATSETVVTAASELFSDRDLEQTADLTAATQLTLTSGQDITLSEEGVYILSGTAENVTIIVDAAEAKVQIVLDGVSITNEDAPAIYVKAADKVFVTSTDSTNAMTVTGSFVADGETNLDAVIFSKADITLNGTGTLEIVSASGNGISSKDDLVVTGGVYTIEAAADGLEANDAILIGGGTLTINAGADALHCENSEDETLGYIYIENGTLNITAGDDAIRGNSLITIDGGTINIETCQEAIEATQIIINNGEITLYAANDGINAAPKVSGDVFIEVNGGVLNLTIGSGDTDAFDSNGDITINGGTISIEATSAFDPDGTAVLNGGTVTVNGQTITEITVQQMGGGGGGGGKHGM